MYTALLSSVSFWVHQGMQTNPLHTAFIHVWKNLHTSSGSVYSKSWSFSSMTYLISVRGTNTFLYQGNSALDPWVTALGAWAHGATWGHRISRSYSYARWLAELYAQKHTPLCPLPPNSTAL